MRRPSTSQTHPTKKLSAPRQSPKDPKINAAERRRLEKLVLHENAAREQGYLLIAGIDEAGRGPLAGPVVAAACVIPAGLFFAGIDDSKKLTPPQRGRLFEQLTTHSEVRFGIGVVSHLEIDTLNIHQATFQAMLQAVAKLALQPDMMLVDGFKLIHPTIPSQKIIRGDQLSQSIAAASIIAKETRDRLMVGYHEQWPHYGFDQHKGYGTEKHLEAIAKHGPCPIHRLTFAPLKSDG